MSHPAAPVQCYLVEWYKPRLAAEPIEATAATLDDCAASMSKGASTAQRLTSMVDAHFGAATADLSGTSGSHWYLGEP